MHDMNSDFQKYEENDAHTCNIKCQSSRKSCIILHGVVFPFVGNAILTSHDQLGHAIA